MIQDTLTLTLTLADGRTLSYSHWGPADATPVFYFHGFPTSRHELELARPRLEQATSPSVSSRSTGPVSEPQPSDRTAPFSTGPPTWPKPPTSSTSTDSPSSAFQRGPYALACGHALPDRVTRVGVVARIAPMEATVMDKADTAQTAKNWWFLRVQFTMVAFAFSKGQEDKIVAQAMATMGEADQRALEQTATRNSFIEMTRGAFTQGGSAATHEAGLYHQPWGFNPAHITVPTDLWYGGADEMVPPLANGSPTASPDRATPSGRTTDTSPGATATRPSTSSPQ
jgi:pimeloyl-ACP methyl ester carboxylesterase